MTVTGGSVGENFLATGDSFVEIDGGRVGDRFESLTGSRVSLRSGLVDRDARFGGVVEITGGVIGPDAAATEGSVVTIRGGAIDSSFHSLAGSKVHIEGGLIGAIFATGLVVDGVMKINGGDIVGGILVRAGGEVTVRGGIAGDSFNTRDGGVVNFIGGVVPPRVSAGGPGNFNLFGGEFLLNGAPPPTPTVTLYGGDYLTGTLADGSPFIIGLMPGSRSATVVDVVEAALPAIDETPIVVDAAGDTPPNGLRSGQALTLRDGGRIGRNFTAVDATLNIEGGELPDRARVIETQVDIRGGTVGRDFEALRGSVVNVRAGIVGDSFLVRGGGELNISGGEVGDFVTTQSGAVVNVTGGILGDNFVVSGVANITGGTFERLIARPGSELHVIGSDFLVDGAPVSVTPGVPRAIRPRNVDALTGTLADGSPFVLPIRGWIDSEALLTVTLAPTPGDYNGDGLIDAADFQAWEASFGRTVVPYSESDGNGDRRINAADYTVWRDAFEGPANPIPEPAAGCVIAATLFITAAQRRAS